MATNLPYDLLTAEEAARLLGISADTLAHQRARESTNTPAWYSTGTRQRSVVLYRHRDIVKFLSQR